jgi:hypothetical protein
LLDIKSRFTQLFRSDKFLKFRNYRPRDADVEKQSTLIERATPANVEDQIAGILALAKQSAAVSLFRISIWFPT